MFTAGTLRYTALIAANTITAFAIVAKPELLTPDTFNYVLIGNFAVAGVDIIKHIKDKVTNK